MPSIRDAIALARIVCPGQDLVQNPGIGGPDNMEIIFNRQIRSVTKGVFRTAVDRDNDGVGRQRLLPGSGPWSR